MKITVIGSGYVGLVTAACFADAGHDVVCLDVDQKKINNIRNGIMPIYEPGISFLVSKNINANRLKFTTNAELAIHFGDLLFICVSTPSKQDGSADLKFVMSAVGEIANNMQESKIIINKSTVPVGTAHLVKKTIQKVLDQRGSDIKFEVCSNPEFLKEGSAIEDFKEADRIIIGTKSQFVKDEMSKCYFPYNKQKEKIIFMDIISAELTKYAANAMLATKISFINEISNIAEQVNADIESVRIGIGSDLRIGYSFINPGCGYGGSCFPKDVKALINTATENGLAPSLLQAVEATNQKQKTWLFENLNKNFDGNLKDQKIAIWGLSYKPKTDDLREASSLVLINELLNAGSKISAYDPEAGKNIQKMIIDKQNFIVLDNRLDVLIDADALVVCTEWSEFYNPNFSQISKLMANKLIIDGRNIFDPKSAVENGFVYFGVGRNGTQFTL